MAIQLANADVENEPSKVAVLELNAEDELDGGMLADGGILAPFCAERIEKYLTSAGEKALKQSK